MTQSQDLMRSYTMNSILDLDKPFIAFVLRHLKGEAAVKCLNESKQTQS